MMPAGRKLQRSTSQESTSPLEPNVLRDFGSQQQGSDLTRPRKVLVQWPVSLCRPDGAGYFPPSALFSIAPHSLACRILPTMKSAGRRNYAFLSRCYTASNKPRINPGRCIKWPAASTAFSIPFVLCSFHRRYLWYFVDFLLFAEASLFRVVSAAHKDFLRMASSFQPLSADAITGVPFAEKWELLRPVIEQLYLKEDMKLPQLQRVLRERYNFDAR